MWNHIIAVRDMITGVSYKAKLVLYALASRADKNGMCRPSTETLVSDTGLSRSGVLRAIKEAEDCEAIIRFGGEYAGRTNRYQLTFRADKQVVNSSNGKIADPCQVDMGRNNSKQGNPCQVDTPPVSSRHPPRVRLTPEEEREVTKEVSKLVCADEGGVKLKRVVDNSPSVYSYGWKPTTPSDRSAAVKVCYELGASREEAESFARFNGSRRWSAVNGTCSVADLARLWVDEWAERNESAFEYEKQRRRSQSLVRS